MATRHVREGGSWGGWAWGERRPPLTTHFHPGLGGAKTDGATPPFARAALSLASRAPSPHPRPSLLWPSAATSARLRRALRSVSSNPCLDTSCRENGPRVRNLHWNPTSRILLRRRKFLRARTHYSRKVLRDCPAALRKLTTDRRRLPLPPRQLPLLRGQTQRQRLMSRLRHERRLTSRCGVSGTRRVPNCPGASPPPSRPPRHTLASGTTSPIKARAKAAAPRPYNAAAPRGPAPAPDRSCAQHTGVHAATSRHCVSGAGRVARCPGTANPVWRPARHFNPGSRPARHTLAMRPPQKARPFSFINHPRAERRRGPRERGSAHSSTLAKGNGAAGPLGAAPSDVVLQVAPPATRAPQHGIKITGERPSKSPNGHPSHHTTSPGTEARPWGHPPATQPPQGGLGPKSPQLRPNTAPSAHHHAPPSRAACSRHPLAPPTRATRSRCQLAPPARAVRSCRNQRPPAPAPLHHGPFRLRPPDSVSSAHHHFAPPPSSSPEVPTHAGVNPP